MGNYKWFVSRQHYWGVEDDDGDDPTWLSHVVEIVSNGLEFANPDMLGVRWKHLGEGREYNDPREAVDAAISIRDAWQATNPKYEDGAPIRIGIAMGSTGGMTMPLECGSDENLVARAEKAYQALEKCVNCGEIMGKNRYGDACGGGDFEACSEYCAEAYYSPAADETDEENE